MPYLTTEVPGIGGRIKDAPDDFQVEEVPLYEACGEGTHTYFQVEKESLSTMRAVRDVARALGVRERDVGYAGLKDADAVTRQVFSIEHVDPEKVLGLEVPRITIRWAKQHGNKLKLGHLRGNRFVIKLRDADASRIDDVRTMADVLTRRGVPNHFGPQRFGNRGNTWQIGRAMLAADWHEAVNLLLGRPGPGDTGDVLRARNAYEEGDYVTAAEAWPHPFRDERSACRTLVKTKGSHKRAFFSVNIGLKRLYISAFQSYLFNAVVATRLSTLDRLMTGDLAWRHANGAVFTVEDAAVEQPRCDAFEISPSGPLFGYRMTEPQGEPGEIEARILAGAQLEPGDFRASGAHKVKGARRPLRFRPDDFSADTGSDERGDYIELRFALRSGCYATSLLRELCKTPELDPGAATVDG